MKWKHTEQTIDIKSGPVCILGSISFLPLLSIMKFGGSMQYEAWINWAVRIFLLAMILLVIVALFRWTRGKKGAWNEKWAMLAGTVKNQVYVLLLASVACFFVTLLWPLANLGAGAAETIAKLIRVSWVAIGAWGVSLLFSILMNTIRGTYDVEVEDNLIARRMHTKIRIIQKTVVVILWIAATAGMLMQFDSFRALGTTLLASAGVLSIVLGISAQKTFGSMIAGMQIALSHPISLDDVVIVEGEWGRIEEITFTYVVVKIWDQRRLVVPVTYFLEKPFQNWTRTSSDIIGSVLIHLDYNTPLEPLRDEARRLCESAGKLWDGKTCVLQVTEAGAETMTVRVLASSGDASKAWDLRCLLREGLIDFVRTHHPECLPKRRIVMGEEPLPREL